MKKMIKRILYACLALTLIFAFLLNTPIVSGKYMKELKEQPIWQTLFTDAQQTGVFSFSEIPGNSGHMWGIGEEELKSLEGSAPSDELLAEYGILANNVDVAYPVYNNSEKYGLLTFDVSYTAMQSKVGSTLSPITYSISISKTDDEGNTTTTEIIGNFLTGGTADGTNVLAVEAPDGDELSGALYTGTGYIFGIISTEYEYLYYDANVNPYLLSQVYNTDNTNGLTAEKLKAFVIAPNETATCTIELGLGTGGTGGLVSGENATAVYGSIQLNAIECDENGIPINANKKLLYNPFTKFFSC
ncbi:MAG: hypothetical protein IJW55_00265 [Clostridia bacterium]|nr:hypothetical protein [Clostridia bacterium]